jgi:hypothetical protein
MGRKGFAYASSARCFDAIPAFTDPLSGVRPAPESVDRRSYRRCDTGLDFEDKAVSRAAPYPWIRRVSLPASQSE